MNTHKLDQLRQAIPATLQRDFTIVPDQIKGNRYALAKINTEYSRLSTYGHFPETKFYDFNQMIYFLEGMQEGIRIIITNH